MDNSDADAILASYQAGEGRSDDKVFARLVGHAEIEENGWDLNIGRYLKAATSETVDIAAALSSLAVAQVALRAAEARLAERLEAAGYA
jgi:type I restriction enzyme M protein